MFPSLLGQVSKALCSSRWIRRKSWPRPKSRGRLLRIVDLFCGCGGLSLGTFEAARLYGRRPQIALAVDLDDTALAVYRANFGVGTDVARSADVAELFAGRPGAALTGRERRLRQSVGRVHVLVAGPPCQGHSDLNNSSRRQDPRNSLYLRVVRAAKVLRPDTVVIENVPAVVHDKGRVVSRARNELVALGYHVADRVVAATKLGLAQTRKRHILVATRKIGFDFRFLDHQKAGPAALRDYIRDLDGLNGSKIPLFDEASRMNPVNARRARFLYRKGKYNLPNRLRPPCHRDVQHSYVSMYGRLRWDRPAQTITSGFGCMGQGRFLHPRRCRTLTPHEAARLQGFPDFFDFGSVKARTALQTTIGNAVPPKLAAVFIDRLLRLRIL